MKATLFAVEPLACSRVRTMDHAPMLTLLAHSMNAVSLLFSKADELSKIRQAATRVAT